MSKSKMLEGHIKALKGLGDKTAQAGWFESARYPVDKEGNGGESVAYIARILNSGATIKKVNEDGVLVITIPARPFMRLARFMFMQERKALEKRLSQRIIRGKLDPEQFLNQIGMFLEGKILTAMKEGDWAPNAPWTIRAKGFDQPLVESGHMAQSVTSKVT